MSNKLKDIFSKNDQLIKGTIKFKDAKAAQDFANALETVYKNGEAKRVEGIQSMSLKIQSGASTFPFSYTEDLGKLVVGPSPYIKSLNLKINDEVIPFLTECCLIKNGYIIQTPRDFIMHTKIIFDYTEHTAKVSIKPEVDAAPDISTVLKSIK